MENINVNQEVVETVVEEGKSINWAEVGVKGLAFAAGAYVTYKGIKFVVNKAKAKKKESKKLHEVQIEETDVTEETK